LTLGLLSRRLVWREALTIVKPDALIRWHRKGFRLFWRWKSKPRGRSPVPTELQEVIVEMAHDNPTWGEERVAAELLLKLGIRISPRTVRRYRPPDKGPQRGPKSRRWMTFIRTRYSGLRLLRHGDGQFSGAVPLRDHGGRNTADRSLQRHRPSRIGRDGPADGQSIPLGQVPTLSAS
jgi:hypothetical protein